MSTVQILKNARELISDPKRWCKGTLAKNNKGESVSGSSPEACAWCVIGVVSKISYSNDSFSDVMDILYDVSEKALASFNDDPYTTHEEILELFDKAILEAEKNYGI